MPVLTIEDEAALAKLPGEHRLDPALSQGRVLAGIDPVTQPGSPAPCVETSWDSFY
ncbi:hypothetical protein [Bradyrhizobium sp. SYSU BS000235]|uniref:hypothetical protein n=1 Tax=Bradyrhizobium sp. SYSU BS000235 TaxID=3411332 RepID=UPI003C74BA69